ncbi:MAG: short-chain dehydrogenase [Clostridia bacterium]|jgi:NAD(P)-dependent dehydrogenase (short-subunit alcohol dehydrogenase family)|nr:MAG: short-chain dehydrogenase [Clostridia bacterium]
MPNKVAIITGASGGIGLATAALFAEKGYAVYGLSRKPYDSGPVIHIPTDVTDASSVRAAVSTVIAGEGRIDVLVCNAGFGISGAIEFTEPSDAKRQFDVNFFGALHCIQAVLPQMRAQHSGCILCVSSVAAVLSIPFQSFYSAAKASINALCAALANEVRPYGIRVAALMPGDIKTGFTAAREKSFAGKDVYPALPRSVATMEHDEATGMEPVYIAHKLFRLSQKRALKPNYTAGLQYQFFVMLRKFLPYRFINWLVGMLYAK